MGRTDEEAGPAGRRRCRPAVWLFCERLAQGALEYALVLCALLALVAGLAAIWHAGERGTFSLLVERAASHGLDQMGLADILLY